MAAKSYNLLHAIGGVYPEQYIDYQKALVSMGAIPLPSEVRCSRTKEGILFQWENEAKNNAFDTLVVIANMRGQYFTEFKLTGVERSEGSFLWKIHLSPKETYDLWVVFRDQYEKDFSNSLWLGSVDAGRAEI